MKRALILILLSALAILTACAALPAASTVKTGAQEPVRAVEISQPEQIPAQPAPEAAAPDDVPGLPNTCSITAEAYALRQECLALGGGACPAGERPCGDACPAAVCTDENNCLTDACPAGGSCTAGNPCLAGEDCPAGDACPAAQTLSVQAGDSCLISYEMILAAMSGVYQSMTPAEAKARLESGDPVILLDVRTQAEYDDKHIPGARLLPSTDIQTTAFTALPDPAAEILVYCRSGRRSKEAVEKLVALGYTNVYDIGGILDWPYEIVTGE